MRKIATIQNKTDEIVRLMLYKKNDEIYLFGYNKKEDCSCLWDQFYDDISELYDECKERFGVEIDDWIMISNPLENCQHDWIEPVRRVVKDGQVVFEKLID